MPAGDEQPSTLCVRITRQCGRRARLEVAANELGGIIREAVAAAQVQSREPPQWDQAFDAQVRHALQNSLATSIQGSQIKTTCPLQMQVLHEQQASNSARYFQNTPGNLAAAVRGQSEMSCHGRLPRTS